MVVLVTSYVKHIALIMFVTHFQPLHHFSAAIQSPSRSLICDLWGLPTMVGANLNREAGRHLQHHHDLALVEGPSILLRAEVGPASHGKISVTLSG